MNISRLRKFLISGLTGAVLATSGLVTATASAGQGVHVRGTVVSLSDDQLLVNSRDDQPITVKLMDDWMVSAVMRASIDDIEPGDFVGIASLPTSEGGDGALEVLIFPPALKGSGEGSYGWDLEPNSTMTNATVGDAVKSVDGSTVTVNYHGQEKEITIPNGTPIVTLAPATPDDVTPGTAVFIRTQKDANGMLSSSQLIVGKNGVVPPM